VSFEFWLVAAATVAGGEALRPDLLASGIRPRVLLTPRGPSIRKGEAEWTVRVVDGSAAPGDPLLILEGSGTESAAGHESPLFIPLSRAPGR
jgi:hypothetical protein